MKIQAHITDRGLHGNVPVYEARIVASSNQNNQRKSKIGYTKRQPADSNIYYSRNNKYYVDKDVLTKKVSYSDIMNKYGAVHDEYN